jgi:hypothetical protein
MSKTLAAGQVKMERLVQVISGLELYIAFVVDLQPSPGGVGRQTDPVLVGMAESRVEDVKLDILGVGNLEVYNYHLLRVLGKVSLTL